MHRRKNFAVLYGIRSGNVQNTDDTKNATLSMMYLHTLCVCVLHTKLAIVHFSMRTTFLVQFVKSTTLLYKTLCTLRKLYKKHTQLIIMNKCIHNYIVYCFYK